MNGVMNLCHPAPSHRGGESSLCPECPHCIHYSPISIGKNNLHKVSTTQASGIHWGSQNIAPVDKRGLPKKNRIKVKLLIVFTKRKQNRQETNIKC